MSDTSIPIRPVPEDDGASDHLPGASMPDLDMPTTDGATRNLARAVSGRWVLFVYPRTGVPGEDEPAGWDDIPGARGCTAEACGFRDNLAALHSAGATAVFGLSAQESSYQAEAVQRLHLPYPLLSDPTLRLRDLMGFPVFEAGGLTLYKRMTLVLNGPTIEHVFYPIFPPEEHAARVAAWMSSNPLGDVPGAAEARIRLRRDHRDHLQE